MPSHEVPAIRTRNVNHAPERPDGEYVLYWMVAFRRCRWNFALQRAVEWATRLDRPLIVLEALRAGYPWASDRLHAFVLQGMADNRARLAGGPARHYAYVEPAPDAGKGLLAAVAGRAAVVVTDDSPAFFLRRMVEAAGRALPVRLESVDSNGLLPLAAAARAFPTAFAFRAFLQRNLRAHLDAFPVPDPIAAGRLRPAPELPQDVHRRWPPAADALLATRPGTLATLPIDHRIGVAPIVGGGRAADARLAEFLDRKLADYRDERNQPERDVSSGLSPYLHFGHISVHEVFSELMGRERWTSRRLSDRATGKRDGWWGASPSAESFLDELVTWREIGYGMSHVSPDCDRYESLPAWARATLDGHAADRREHAYTLEALEAGGTHDPLWNAAQMQLVREGRLHNYLRMLWGKKILEWTRSPREALDVMITLNNRYALDGRDPNSYSGIFWVLGRYDRPWAPERPVFGRVRYMSSENTARKVRVREYVRKYAP